MNNYDSSITGIVIDQYPSVAEVVKIMRKYTKDSIMEIRVYKRVVEKVFNRRAVCRQQQKEW